MGLGAINANAVNVIPINGSFGGGFVLPTELPLGDLICVPEEQTVWRVPGETHVLYATCEQSKYLVPSEETTYRIPAGNRAC